MMPRFSYPQTVTKIRQATESIREAKESIDYAEPVAGWNRGVLREASADLTWALVMLDRALQGFDLWRKQGPKGSPSVEERLRRSRQKS